MLASALAVLLGLGSFVFYMAAFVYPEVHRRLDLLWSGLGLLYAGVLWFDAEQMTGFVLLGQMLAVVLLLALGWQTLTVRRQKTPVSQQTPIVLTPEVLGGWAKSKLNDLRIAPDESVRSVRLERRVAEDPALLSSRLDPRRRPAYDYEFVEDGVAEVQQGELFAEFSEKAFSVEDTDSSEEEMVVSAYAVPPSAEAEVVTVETPSLEKADDVSNDVSEVKAAPAEAALEEDVEIEAISAEVEEASTEESSTEISVLPSEPEETIEDSGTVEALAKPLSEDVAFELDEIEDAGAEIVVPEPSRAEDELDSDETERFDEVAAAELDVALDDAAIPQVSESAIVEEIDWAEASPVMNSDSPVRPAAREKPSLLEMPVILVGWVKDVVVSMTKPKPSKPMIEIPRRDPMTATRSSKGDVGDTLDRSADSPATENAVISDSRYNDNSEDDNFRDDDWEDSNWAD